MLNKRDVGYSILARYEDIYRRYICKIFSSKYPKPLDGIPDHLAVTEEAVLKTAEDEGFLYDLALVLNETNLTALKEITFHKNNFASLFPNFAGGKQKFNEIFDRVYGLRCKVAHIKGSFSYDNLMELIELIEKISPYFNSFDKTLSEFLDAIKTKPETIKVPKMPDWFFDDGNLYSIPNNLPVPDYELDGGFVGRKKDVLAVQKLLTSNTHRVVTITGAGGVGKSALAVRAVTELLEKKVDSFEGVVWISAKLDHLTSLGIEELDQPAVKSHDELVRTILDVMHFLEAEQSREDNAKTLQLVCELCTKKLLVIIDNYETINDSAIEEFILDGHENIKFLITSRRGLGQVERRCPLQEMEVQEAAHLFRQTAREKGLKSLACMEQEDVERFVKDVFYYPLAIKWSIGRFALGKSLDSTISSISDSSSDISLFCFEQTYRSLSFNATVILCSLSQCEQNPTLGTLCFISEKNNDEVDEAIQELTLVSFVTPEYDKGETKYFLLPLTRGYVITQLNKNPSLKEQITNKLRHLQLLEEDATRAQEVYKNSLTFLGANTQAEKVAAVYENSAYMKYRAGEYDEAVRLYAKAIRQAPNFGPIYRNWAQVELKEGKYHDAEKLIEKAAQLNPEDHATWQVWGRIALKRRQFDKAIEYLNKSITIMPTNSISFNCLGLAFCRIGKYAEAETNLKRSLELGSRDNRDEIINRCSLADNYYRWSEQLLEIKNYKQCEDLLFEAEKNCEIALKIDHHDARSISLCGKIHILQFRLYRALKNFGTAEYCLTKIINREGADSHNRIFGLVLMAEMHFYDLKDSVKARSYLPTHALSGQEMVASWLKVRITKLEDKIKTGSLLEGTIIQDNTSKSYILIRAKDQKTYCGLYNDFQSLIPHSELMNRTVQFRPVKNNQQKFMRAIEIQLS